MDSLAWPPVPAWGQIVRRAGGWTWGPGSPESPALRGNGGGLGAGLSWGPGVGPGELAMEPSHRNRHTQVIEKHSSYWTRFPHTYLLQTPLALSQLAPTTFPQIPGLLCLASAFWGQKCAWRSGRGPIVSRKNHRYFCSERSENDICQGH